MHNREMKIAFFLWLSLFILPSPILAAPVSKIFILHSYDQTDVCGQPQANGVISALAKAGYTGDRLLVETYFMDTKRRNNTPELIAAQARIALNRIKAFNPQVLVSLDDHAFNSVALKLVGTPIQIVFSGLNGQPEDYNRLVSFMNNRSEPGSNVTGVYEKLHIAAAIKIQKRIFPDLQKIRMLSDTSLTGRALVRQVQLELEEIELPVAFDKMVVQSWEEYQAEVHAINEDPEIGTIYPVALLLKDAAGRTYTPPDIFRWTTENCRKPAIALNYEFTSMGLFGGAAVDFEAMGRQAGAMVLKILQGRNAGEIPIENAQRYALVFNLDRAQSLGITIPEDILLAADEIVSQSRR